MWGREIVWNWQKSVAGSSVSFTGVALKWCSTNRDFSACGFGYVVEVPILVIFVCSLPSFSNPNPCLAGALEGLYCP